MKIIIMIIITLTISISINSAYSEPVVLDENYKIEKFAEGLTFPISMVFIDEQLFVTEKNSGKILKISENGIVEETPSLLVSTDSTNVGLEVSERVEFYADRIQCHCGLLGITYNGENVYVFHTGITSDLEDRPNTVTKYRFDGTSFVEPTIMKSMEGSDKDHVGGVLTTGLNGEVYFVIGDQDEHFNIHVNMPNGMETYEKISKLNPVEMPEPLINTDIASIFMIKDDKIEQIAMGVRNSFGLAVDPLTGKLWATENGPSHYDEINLVEKKFNSGWSVLTGPIDRFEEENRVFDKTLVLDPTLADLSRIDFEDFEYSDPEFSWEIPVAVTAIAFPNFNSFGDYFDFVFVGDFNTGSIYSFKLNENRDGFDFSHPGLTDLVYDWDDRFTSEEIFFARALGPISDIEFHDDGMYVSTIFDGSIYKISSKEIPSPLKQQKISTPNEKIVCVDKHMPIMDKSGTIACVSPKTALILQERGWILNSENMPKIVLKNQNLAGLNFDGINLSEADFRNVDFRNVGMSKVDFSNSNLAYSNLSGKDLNGVALNGALLRGANLDNANLEGVDLSYKDLTESILANLDLNEINLTGARLTNADFSGTSLAEVRLVGVDFTGADLNNKVFTATNLENSIFQDAKLHNVDFEDANLKQVDFRGADLTNAKFHNSELNDALFADAKLSEIDISQESFMDVSFFKANLQNTIIENFDFENRDLTFADLSNLDLSQKNLEMANLEGANLSGTILPPDMKEMDLTGAKFIGTDLTNQNFTESILDFAVFDESRFGKIVLERTYFIEADFRKIKDKTMEEVPPITGTSFAYAKLDGITLPKDLSAINFRGAEATNADFSNSSIKKTFFHETNLEGANFEGADLTGNKFTAVLPHSYATKSIEEIMKYISPLPTISLLDLEVTDEEVLFHGYMFNLFFEANLIDANLSNADLSITSFNSSDLTNANLSYSKMNRCDFALVNLTNANLEGADMQASYLANSTLTNANLKGANLEDANLEGANLEGANLEGANLNCIGHEICN